MLPASASFLRNLSGCESSAAINATLIPCADFFFKPAWNVPTICHTDSFLVYESRLVKGRALARSSERNERFEPFLEASTDLLLPLRLLLEDAL